MSEESDNTSFDADAWVQRWAQRAAEAQERGINGLKAAIPFLAQLGVTMITLTYNGEGDSGDIDDITISGLENAPKTCEELDEALKKFPPETQAYERFNVEKLKDYTFEILPGGFEINEGSYGQVILDCEKNKVRREHNERVMDINYDEQEW